MAAGMPATGACYLISASAETCLLSALISRPYTCAVQVPQQLSQATNITSAELQWLSQGHSWHSLCMFSALHPEVSH